MTWDFTNYKRASKKSRVVKCPVCGKYGQARIYIDADRTPKFAGLLVHSGHVEIGMFNVIDESCNLNLEQANEIRDWLRS